jgi:hypothetical protein
MYIGRKVYVKFGKKRKSSKNTRFLGRFFKGNLSKKFQIRNRTLLFSGKNGRTFR